MLDEVRLIATSCLQSASFVIDRCLEVAEPGIRATSSFVDEFGNPMLWHEFGPLVGPGWAANALGGVLCFLKLGKLAQAPRCTALGIDMTHHILEGGYVDEQTGFIWPYFHKLEERFCLNYTHTDEWFCPGSLARVGTQLLEIADLSPELADPARRAALGLADWFLENLDLLYDGWVPRRTTGSGDVFKQPGDDLWDASADGLYLLEFYLELVKRDLKNVTSQASGLARAYSARGGIFGSINHDTYDPHESVAYASGYRILRLAAQVLEEPEFDHLAQACLEGLERFWMREDRHGVSTANLLYMEDSWNTAYLWENAEAALAYTLAGGTENLQRARDLLVAISRHHYGPYGFLTEGVDWDNQVGQQHHRGDEYYGPIAYTEPLLNNLYVVEPTLAWLKATHNFDVLAIEARHTSCATAL